MAKDKTESLVLSRDLGREKEKVCVCGGKRWFSFIDQCKYLAWKEATTCIHKIHIDLEGTIGMFPADWEVLASLLVR